MGTFIYLENNHCHSFWVAILEVATYHLPTLNGSALIIAVRYIFPWKT